MKLLLDTHAFLWMINDDYSHLRGKTATELFLDENNQLFLSMASVWEMAIKVRLGKLDLHQPLAELIPTQTKLNNIELLDIKLEHTLQTLEIPFHHKDPFDRLIIAQSQDENMTLLSVDSNFAEYDIKQIW